MALYEKIKGGEFQNIAIVIAVLIAVVVILGVSSLLAPSPARAGALVSSNPCIPTANFTCSNLSYGAGQLSFLFGQNTGSTYYGDWIFVASANRSLNSSSLPAAFSTQNATALGTLNPGQTVTVKFTNFAAGGIPSNPTSGTMFDGYVWLGYCTSVCSYPTYFVNAAKIQLASASGIASS